MRFPPLHEVSWLWLVVYFLATYRLTSALYSEKIGAGFRKLLGAQETEDTIIYPSTFLGNLVSCFWCLSMWVAGLFLPFLLFVPEVLLPFAASAVAIVIHERVLSHG